jgi:hypothetical protein
MMSILLLAACLVGILVLAALVVGIVLIMQSGERDRVSDARQGWINRRSGEDGEEW